jgi:anti-anti-sigma regulatory factor
VALIGELCVFNAKALKPRLLVLLKPSSELEMDLSQVCEVDTAGIQILLLAKGEAARISCRLNFVRHSEALLDVISLLNLSQDFGDPLLIPARRASELRHEY